MLNGKHLIGKEELVTTAASNFQAINPATNQGIDTTFHDATPKEIDRSAQLAEKAFQPYRRKSPHERAKFLEAIAAEIEGLGDTLIQRCHEETALPAGRLQGERGRTCNQLRLFAELIREGSWVDARIDTAQPDRKPAPKPDVRSMLQALGPVAVFGASNFPLAFSVAGGDTASALAAGCPVIVKAHPAHPGTSELVGRAILEAAQKTGMPEGVFSLVQGQGIEVGSTLVKHPLIKAVGFTGSLRGGRALYDLAASRPEPIPVYAEMGSVNPIFILPGAMKDRHEAMAKGLAGSITLGVGQFCTNPGVVVAQKHDNVKHFLKQLDTSMEESPLDSMLTMSIREGFGKGVENLTAQSDVALHTKTSPSDYKPNQPEGYVFTAKAKDAVERTDVLFEEVFGPSTLFIEADSAAEMYALARKMDGQLTATIHGTPEDLEAHQELIDILERKVGRIVFNGFPTGVEVCHAMIHGGPYPATTAAGTTSVGTKAIERFARPVCYQDFPAASLPDELKNENPLNIWRLVDGMHTNAAISA